MSNAWHCPKDRAGGGAPNSRFVVVFKEQECVYVPVLVLLVVVLHQVPVSLRTTWDSGQYSIQYAVNTAYTVCSSMQGTNDAQQLMLHVCIESHTSTDLP